MNGDANVPTKQARVVGLHLIVLTQDLDCPDIQQRRVPLTAHHAMKLLNFVKHRLHGGRLTLENMPDRQPEKKLIVPP